MNVLEATNVVKTFREGSESVPVLRGASLTLHRGEIVALEGPSGSGKTTFLTILGCMLTPTSGRVAIEGREVDPPRPERLPEVRRASIGFVFQQFNLFPALTAAENVEYALNLKGTRGRAAKAEAARMLEAVGLTDRAPLPAPRPLRRAEAASRDRPRPGRLRADHPRRRADRQPRLPGRRAGPRPVPHPGEARGPGPC